MKILITGCAGFIGFHLTKYILDSEEKTIKVYGIDNLSNSQSIDLKKERLKLLQKYSKNFFFDKIDITNKTKLLNSFLKNKYDYVAHLAAEAGVRNSVKNPDVFFDTNLKGFMNILESSKQIKIKHLLYASSSSVYGNNIKFPTKETKLNNKPTSFYAATKICNEVMAYSYSNINKLPSTGLRFFTVYGPYGRPDMAIYRFTRGIINKKYLHLYNSGKDQRDFTNIEDVKKVVLKLLKTPPKGKVPYKIYNLGSSKTTYVKDVVKTIENITNLKSKIIHKPKPKGDVLKTHSDCSLLKKKIAYKPEIMIEEGIENFIKWYKDFYK